MFTNGSIHSTESFNGHITTLRKNKTLRNIYTGISFLFQYLRKEDTNELLIKKDTGISTGEHLSLDWRKSIHNNNINKEGKKKRTKRP